MYKIRKGKNLYGVNLQTFCVSKSESFSYPDFCKLVKHWKYSGLSLKKKGVLHVKLLYAILKIYRKLTLFIFNYS